jgi:hypothetical protein
MTAGYYTSSNIPLPNWSKLKFKKGQLVTYKPNGRPAKVEEYATGYQHPYAIWFLEKHLSWIVADEDELEEYIESYDAPPPKKTRTRKKRTPK